MGGFTNLCDARSMGPRTTGNKEIRGELSRKASKDTEVTLGGTAMQKCLGCNITYLRDGMKAVRVKSKGQSISGQGQRTRSAGEHCERRFSSLGVSGEVT